MSTFIYTKNQEEIAGKDGENTFNKVFGEEARVVVVLYRKGWGNTSWKRIEETAIKNNRALIEGTYELKRDKADDANLIKVATLKTKRMDENEKCKKKLFLFF